MKFRTLIELYVILLLFSWALSYVSSLVWPPDKPFIYDKLNTKRTLA